MKLSRTLTLTCAAFSLASCSLLSLDTDNSPQPHKLTAIKTQAKVTQVWSTRVGKGNAGKALKLRPVIAGKRIFTADSYGMITATAKHSGQIVWQTDAKTRIVSGPSVANNVLVFGTANAEVIALRADNGHLLWRQRVSNEVLAPAYVGAEDVVVKTVDGRLFCFAANSGKKRWSHLHGAPTLILRGSSAPTVAGNKVIAGFEDGKLVALDIASGEKAWETLIAGPKGMSALERMIDIDIDPVVKGNTVYVASYQGALVAIDLRTGNKKWQRPMSAYAGLTINSDSVVITDANSHVWSVRQGNGRVLWHQNLLAARGVTAPISMGNFLVVADSQGYLHWLNQDDGNFSARVAVSSSGIQAAPVASGKSLFVLSNDGTLSKYALA